MNEQINNDLLALKFYVVRNSEGKYFRSKGLHGYGKSWVEDVNKAKIYSKIGPARGQVSFWASMWPEFGIPELIEFGVGQAIVLDETERVKKVIAKKAQYRSQSEIRILTKRIKDLINSTQNALAERQRLQAILDEIDKGKK